MTYFEFSIFYVLVFCFSFFFLPRNMLQVDWFRLINPLSFNLIFCPPIVDEFHE